MKMWLSLVTVCGSLGLGCGAGADEPEPSKEDEKASITLPTAPQVTPNVMKTRHETGADAGEPQ